MKKIFLAFLLVIGYLLAASQKAEVGSTGLLIRNKPVTKTTTPAELREILGTPDRVISLANTIWTYDKRGIYVYFNPADSSIKHISFDLVKHEQKFSPLTTFSGIIVINKHTVSKYTSLQKIMKMKSLRFEANPVWIYAYTGNVKLYFEYDDTKKVLRSVGVALVFKSGKE